MSLITQFPLINSIRFTQYPYVPVPNQTIVGPNQAPFIDSIKPWQSVVNFNVPATFLDTCTVYVNTQLADSSDAPTFQLLNYNQEYLMDITSTEYQVVDGNVYIDPFGTVFPLGATLMQFTWGNLLNPDTDSGIYYIKMKNGYEATGGGYEYWISEPILVQKNHADTTLIAASYNTNRDNVIISGWFSLSPVFYHRVESDIRQFQVKGNQFNYLQQEYNQLTQTSNQWRTWEFYLGFRQGVPDWVMEHTTAALLADNLTIDYYPYVRNAEDGNNNGAMWKKEDANVYPLVAGTCSIREVYNTQSTTTGVNLFYIFNGAALPFAITGILLRNSLTLNTVNIGTWAFYSVDDLNNFVDYLNTVVVSANNMSGIFALDSTNSVFYINGINENWSVLDAGTVLTDWFSVYTKLEIVDGAYIPNSVVGNSDTIMICDYGNQPWPYHLQLKTGAGLTSFHDPMAAGEYTRTFFHNNSLNSFDITTLIFPISVRGYAYATADNACFLGSVPQNLKLFRVRNGFGWVNFDLGETYNVNLRNCITASQSELTYLNVAQQGLGPCEFTLFTVGDFSSLNYINTSINCLTSDDLDTMINGFYTNSSYVSDGYWDMTSQLDPTTGLPSGAAPTAASATARGDLLAAGWTILTD